MRKAREQIFDQLRSVKSNVHPLSQESHQSGRIFLRRIKTRKHEPMLREAFNSVADTARTNIVPELREQALGDFYFLSFVSVGRGVRGHDQRPILRVQGGAGLPPRLVEVIICH